MESSEGFNSKAYSYLFREFKDGDLELLETQFNLAVLGVEVHSIDIQTDETYKDKKNNIKDYSKLVFKYFKNPLVSIIIPVYNQFEYTYSCLRNILKNSGDIEYEVIIADDCSTDFTKDITKVVEGVNEKRHQQI